MSLRSALYSCWDIFQKNCQHAIGIATIPTNPITAPFIPAFIKGFLIDEQELQANSLTPSSEGLYETYVIGTYSDDTKLPTHYKLKHKATLKSNQYQIEVGLTHVKDKVVAAVVGLPLAVLESIWFLLQALVCGLLLLGTTVLLPIVPLILLLSMQPNLAFASFFALLQVEGALFLALLYNLAHAPFRLLKAAAKILALPGVGLIALLDWSDDHPINPETMQEQQSKNPIMESQLLESTLEETVERETWFMQEKNQYHFILGNIDWDSLPTLLQSGLKARYPETKGATVTLTVTDLKFNTESSLANWLPDLGEFFHQIKKESQKTQPQYDQFIDEFTKLPVSQKLLSVLPGYITQLTSEDEETRTQGIYSLQKELFSMADIGLELSIKDQNGNIMERISIAKLTSEHLVLLLNPILKTAADNQITAEWIVKTFLNSIQNPQVFQENLATFLIKSMLPENLQTPEAQQFVSTALQFGRFLLSPLPKTSPPTESSHKPKNSKNTSAVTPSTPLTPKN